MPSFFYLVLRELICASYQFTDCQLQIYLSLLCFVTPGLDPVNFSFASWCNVRLCQQKKLGESIVEEGASLSSSGGLL